MFKEQTHLAIFSPDLMLKILSGGKRIDVRLSQNAIVPYMAIQKGDKILIKKSGGKVYGELIVKNVFFYDNLNKKRITKIKRKYNRQVRADEAFWANKMNSKYATVIFLKSVKRYLSPVKYTKHDRRPWVVITGKTNK